ncbi:TerB family tellurite resistance protein [Maribacter sp. 2307UL18-2]|uniref:TerB family tellurite resistance protein n=1 Tax=Maribacter sp. 2307UL18-2 TaxID=3386274 RepID=UPI0039BCA81A
MNIQRPLFTIAEKLALVNAIDSVIVADKLIHQAELAVMNQLMARIDFDSNFIAQARIISDEQRLLIVKDMSENKKRRLAAILDEVAKADGYVHKKEAELISNICAAMGICTEAA